MNLFLARHLCGWGLILAAGIGQGCRPAASHEAASSAGEARVTRGPLTVWTLVEGTLEARRMETVLSRFEGRATLVELVPEGTQVAPGDCLARLDASQLENDLVRLRNEHVKAEAILDSLEHAELPLERQELAAQVHEARNQLDTENRILADTLDLSTRNLVSSNEVTQQRLRLAGASARLDQLERRSELTERHLHPAKLAQARASLEAARRQMDFAQQQFSNCVITAPAAGLVVYLPVHTGSEFRTLRIGDTVYPNQPFMCLPDMSAFVAQGFIPESDLARIEVGRKAVVTPLAYPDCHLPGTIETVGTMAQSRPGYPAWQKVFRFTVKVEQLDPRLRPGMTLRVALCAADRADAVLIPRAAVQWNNDVPSCEILSARGRERRPLTLGLGDERFFEVLSGAAPGDRVTQP